MKPTRQGEASRRWPQPLAIRGGWRANCAPRPAYAAGKITAASAIREPHCWRWGGLAAVDILLLLPLMFAAIVAMFVMGLVIFVLGIVGIGLLLSLFKIGHFASIAAMVLRAMAGIGLIAGSMGCVALLLLALNGAVKMLGSYARLHYRLLKPEQHPA
jgi:hypothetical protein